MSLTVTKVRKSVKDISQNKRGVGEKSSVDPGKSNQDSGGLLRLSEEENRGSRTQENGLWAPAGSRQLDTVPQLC